MESFDYLYPSGIEDYPAFSTGRGVIFEQYIDLYIEKMNELMSGPISPCAGEYAVIEGLRDNMIAFKEQVSSMDTELDMLLLKVEDEVIDKENNLSLEGV